MNTFKNLLILFLSIIVLIQGVLLLRSLPQRPRKGADMTRVQEKPVAPYAVKVKETPVVVSGRIEVKPVVPVVPAVPVTGKIVLILDDWGYNLKNKDFINGNNFHVTLSVLPFKTYSSEVAELAHENSKDVIVHMPMEPLHKEKYGLEENTILTTMDKTTVLKLLDMAFVSVPFSNGLSNHMGSKATEDSRLIKIIMEYLKSKNFIFVDSFVTNKSVCASVAKKVKIGFMKRDVFIDNEADPVYIRAQITLLAQKAKRSGIAIGIGHDRPHTVAVLKEMIPQLEEQGYKFVTLSEATSV